ncbi:MAG: hypothetical protein KDK99_01715 [Verrucomicrobiales bacterium]|nr:hypothetical protein [Verrucomicrobiales bacterium]
MTTLLRLCLPLAAALLTSCAGYQLGGVKPAHLAEVTRIAVPTFKNNTLEPRLAVLVTNAVIKQLQADGTYQIVSKDDADAVLEAEINYVDRGQFRAVRNNVLRTSQLLVRLRTSYRLVSTADGTSLHRGQVIGESYIVLDPNWQISERQGMEDAAQRLGVTMASEISEGW